MLSAGSWIKGFKILDLVGCELGETDDLRLSTTGCGSEFESMLCLCEEVRGGIALGPRRGSDAISQYVSYVDLQQKDRPGNDILFVTRWIRSSRPTSKAPGFGDTTRRMM